MMSYKYFNSCLMTYVVEVEKVKTNVLKYWGIKKDCVKKRQTMSHKYVQR